MPKEEGRISNFDLFDDAKLNKVSSGAKKLVNSF